MPIPAIPDMAHRQTSIRYSPHHPNRSLHRETMERRRLKAVPDGRLLSVTHTHSLANMLTSETPMFVARIAKVNSLGILSVSL